VQAVIDGYPSQSLTKTDTAFDGTFDVSQLPPGIHTLSLDADGSQSPFANLHFLRSRPLYVLMTTDRDSSDSRDSVLRLHEMLQIEHPGLKITHFFGPYTFTDPGVSPVRRATLAD